MSTGPDVRRLLLIAVALAPASLSGQRLQYVGGGGGLVSPAGSFGDVEKIGWHLSFLAAGRLTGSLSFTVDALYGQTAHKGGVAGTSMIGGATANLAKWLAGDARRVRTFVAAGVGAFRVNVDVPGFGSAAATKLGWAAGGGMVVRSGGRRAFLQARYVSVRTSPKTTTFIPISVGVIFAVGSP